MSHRNNILNALYDHLSANPDDPYLHKGQIERQMMELGWMGDTTGRRLRELVDEGLALKRPYNGSIQYRYAGEIIKAQEEVITMLG